MAQKPPQPSFKASSQIRGVPGGGWGKASRFHVPKYTKTPGPDYKLPTCLSNHTAVPLYKPVNGNPAGGANEYPNPAKDRSAWMIGSIKNEMAYYRHNSEDQGPGQFVIDSKIIKQRAPTNVFAKDARFNKNEERFKLCAGSPGPKYYSTVNNMDLIDGKGPKYSFRSKGLADRSCFLGQKIKDGFVYMGTPATMSNGANIGPSNYSPDDRINKKNAPRPKWSVATRFGAPEDKLFISKKHSKSKIGLNSPGPIYNPSHGTIVKKEKSATPAFKWCP